MKVLAIETSCDETGIALLEGTKTSGGFTFAVLKNALLSQALLHSPYGGVYPNLAKREHIKNLPALFAEFKDAEVDALAVTVGPGLEPALWTGINFAENLAKEWNKPLLGVNHMEGHIISSLAKDWVINDVQFPVLALLVSGGHTEFVLMRDWFDYEIIGATLDDAVGEAFDKVARMLGLPYPGGPEISKIAQRHRESKSGALNRATGHPAAERGPKEREEKLPTQITLPRPMLHTNNCDVSFSGLKTAALYAIKDIGGVEKLSPDQKAAFAAEFEDAVAEIFTIKTRRALVETGAKTFVLGGGVAANRFLREELQKMVLDEFSDVDFRLPDLSITGDNAIMIAEAALTRLLSGEQIVSQELKASGNLSLANS